jgi:hypothetical protein
LDLQSPKVRRLHLVRAILEYLVALMCHLALLRLWLLTVRVGHWVPAHLQYLADLMCHLARLVLALHWVRLSPMGQQLLRDPMFRTVLWGLGRHLRQPFLMVQPLLRVRMFHLDR